MSQQRTPHVFAAIISPYNKVDFSEGTEEGKRFEGTCRKVSELSSQISGKSPMILAYPRAKRSNINNFLSYLAQPKGKTSDIPSDKFGTNKLYKVESGDFVFVFIVGHGGFYRKSDNVYQFTSNRNYANRLREGEKETAFYPQTKPLYGNRPKSIRELDYNKKIKMQSFPASYVDNASSRRLPYIKTEDLNSTFSWPIYDQTDVDKENISCSWITFKEKKATVYKEDNTSYSFTYFHQYRRTSTNGISSDEFYSRVSLNYNEPFGSFPPSKTIPYIVLGNTEERNKKNGTLELFSNHDFSQCLKNATTNIFVVAECCYSGGFTIIHPFSNQPYSIWASTSPDATSWNHAITNTSYFIQAIYDILKQYPTNSKYIDVKNKSFQTTHSINTPNGIYQTPKFYTFGAAEFDGADSKHQKFPHNGELLN